MPDLRLVIWDVDGTLVNSRASILIAMKGAFESVGLAYPGDAAALSGVGLSLRILFERLVPGADADTITALVDGYKQTYYNRRVSMGAPDLAPFYPGIKEVLDHLKSEDWTLMATATGKSRRGLEAMIAGQGLEGYFFSTQTADDHPSKPHPAMILQALAETGVAASQAVMIGDTSFDIDMGRAAGVRTLGVGWGYHPVDDLAADLHVQAVMDLIPAINQLTRSAA